MEKKGKGKSFWNSGNKEISSGVAILIKGNTELESIMTKQDKEGKILLFTFLF